MHIPKQFMENNLETLQTLIQEFSFATMISQHDGSLLVSHVPLLLEAGKGRYGTLIGHLATANPQAKDLGCLDEVLLIFQGPHGYISPRLYENEPKVPTWNYAVIHAYGKPKIIDAREQRLELLQKMVDFYELNSAAPWPFEIAKDRVTQLLSAITGFEIEIHRLEGKFKLSQNRTKNEQQRIARSLMQSFSASARTLGELMMQRQQEPPPSTQ